MWYRSVVMLIALRSGVSVGGSNSQGIANLGVANLTKI
jgi:hypothetical protein